MKPGRKRKSPYASDRKHQQRPWLSGLAAQAERIVEVGVFTGRTTGYLARHTTATIWGVDHWRGPAAYPGIGLIVNAKSERRFRRRLKPWIENGRVVVVKMESTVAADYLLADHGPVMDLVFIDAAHDYESVRKDIAAWRKCVRPGGILCGHDINWPGVGRAVGEAFPEAGRGGGYCWWTEIGP